MFDIRLSQEQCDFRDLARKFAREEIKPKAMALDREPEWEKQHVQKHVSFPFPSRFKITEALVGFKRKVPPFHGGD